MSRFILIGNTEFNIDHIVSFAKPLNKPVMMFLSIAGSPMIALGDQLEGVVGAIKLAGREKDFVCLTSTTLVVGKIWIGLQHVACIQEVTQGASLLLSKPGAPPEVVRETPEQIRKLIVANSYNGVPLAS